MLNTSLALWAFFLISCETKNDSAKQTSSSDSASLSESNRLEREHKERMATDVVYRDSVLHHESLSKIDTAHKWLSATAIPSSPQNMMYTVTITLHNESKVVFDKVVVAYSVPYTSRLSHANGSNESVAEDTVTFENVVPDSLPTVTLPTHSVRVGKEAVYAEAKVIRHSVNVRSLRTAKKQLLVSRKR